MIRDEARKNESRRERSDNAGFDVKLGRGGIREVEFTAQLFQIVRGGQVGTGSLADVVAGINERHENSLYLKHIPLSPAIQAVNELSRLDECEAFLLVTPAQHLRAVAERLLTTVRPFDDVGRSGADEFVAISCNHERCRGVETKLDAVVLRQQALSQLAERIDIRGRRRLGARHPLRSREAWRQAQRLE